MIEKYEWNYLDPSEFNKNLSLEDWKKIWHKYPPSFVDVWVLIGEKKKKAYLDAPNKRWLAASNKTWFEEEVNNVLAWSEMKSFPLKRK